MAGGVKLLTEGMTSCNVSYYSTICSRAGSICMRTHVVFLRPVRLYSELLNFKSMLKKLRSRIAGREMLFRHTEGLSIARDYRNQGPS